MQFTIFVFILMRSVDANTFLKFGMIERYPDFFLEEGNSTAVRNYVGSWVYATKWLSQRFNFTYSIIPTGTDVGRSATINGSGSWSGASGWLLQGKFDVLGPPVLMTLARLNAFEYTGIAEDEKSALLTPALTEESPILSTLRPFKLTVWVVSIIALLLVAACFTASAVINRKGQTQWRLLLSPGRHVLNAMAIITNQGEITYQNRLSYRLVGAAWCIFALVMINLYSSTLTSHITARKMELPPRSSIQVVEEEVLDYLMLEYGFGQELILGAKNGPLKKMGDAFRRKPENLIPDRETGFRKVASGCCAFSEFLSYLEYRTAKDLKETGKCRVHIGNPISGYGFGGLLVNKGNPYRDKINLGVLEMHQAGLIGYWRNQYVRGNEASICKTQNKKPKKLRRLNLYDLASAFFILFLGYIFSILLFATEQFRRLKWFRRRN